jgi:hypothetical protein
LRHTTIFDNAVDSIAMLRRAVPDLGTEIHQSESSRYVGLLKLL